MLEGRDEETKRERAREGRVRGERERKRVALEIHKNNRLRQACAY
jgi:hypothetical protein